MIFIKTQNEIEMMRESGKILAALFKELKSVIQPGISTKQIDSFAEDFIRKAGAIPGFLGYSGFPATLCLSIDEEIVHGIPSDDRILKDGQIVGVDVGAILNGYYSDAARTYAVGRISEEKQRLMKVTEEARDIGIAQAFAGNKLGTLGHAIQEHVEQNGFSIVREYVGHGIGKKLHEEPQVPNYGVPHTGIKLMKGMCLAIEPMVNVGSFRAKTKSDGWTVVTIDGKPSAHFEDSIAVTDGEPIILTR